MNTLDMGVINRTFFEVVKRQTMMSFAYGNQKAKNSIVRRKANGFSKYI